MKELKEGRIWPSELAVLRAARRNSDAVYYQRYSGTFDAWEVSD